MWSWAARHVRQRTRHAMRARSGLGEIAIERRLKMAQRGRLRHVLAVSTVLTALLIPTVSVSAARSTGTPGRSLDPGTQFYVAKPDHGASDQIAALTASGDKAD